MFVIWFPETSPLGKDGYIAKRYPKVFHGDVVKVVRLYVTFRRSLPMLAPTTRDEITKSLYESSLFGVVAGQLGEERDHFVEREGHAGTTHLILVALEARAVLHEDAR